MSRNIFRGARFPCVLFLIVSLAAVTLPRRAEPQSADSSNPKPGTAESEKDLAARRQAALDMLDQVLAGSRNLILPQNRITVESALFPLMWNHNQSQARAIVNQLTGDFAQSAARLDERPDPNLRQALRQQWQIVLQTISQSDAESALSFMNASRSFVPTGNPEQEEAEERSLRLQIAMQEAAHNPRNALRIAEKDLQAPGDLPQELINLQSLVAAQDAEAGAQLLHEIVGRLRGEDLCSADSNFNFALNLLNSQFATTPAGATPDDALKTLAENVISATLNPQFPLNALPRLQGYMPTFERFAPGRVEPLDQKLKEYLHTLAPEDVEPDAVAQAQASGDPNQILNVADQAPADVRPNLYQQAAWQFAGAGDLQRARQAADNLPDSVQRDQIMQQAITQSMWNASGQGQFVAARQLAQQIVPEENRATILAQLALNAAAKQPGLAAAMLDEAAGILANRAPGAPLFAAQLQVAQAYLHLKPARALPILERSAGQLEQVLAAVVEVDAFLPYHSFESGELNLNNGFLFNSLVLPYIQATAELASSDLPTARILADRLHPQEARLMAELSVARTVLGADPSPAPVSIRRAGRHLIALQ